MKEKERYYITAFVFDKAEKYLCISPFPVLSPEPPSCKFGICQVGFKRDPDSLPSSLSHLLSALSGWICVGVTPTHMAKAFNMNVKPWRGGKNEILQYVSITFEMDLDPNAAAAIVSTCVCVLCLLWGINFTPDNTRLGCGVQVEFNWSFKQNNSSVALMQCVI